MRNLSRGLLILFIVIVLVLVGLGIWLGMSFGHEEAASAASPYSAVYLSSGDVYFGKLSWFPSPKLTNVWYLQRGVNQQNQPQVGIAPLKSVLWGPVDQINLNAKDILFWTRLRNDSDVAKAMDNPNAIAPTSQQQQPAPQQQPASSSNSSSSSK